MLRFLANTEMLFTESPWTERFQKAADAGFRVVEIWVPYRVDVDVLGAELRRTGLELLQFNMAMGDAAQGEKGLLCLPDRVEEFRKAFERDLETGKTLGVKQFNCPAGNRSDRFAFEDHLSCMRRNLEWMSPRLQAAGLRVNIEPLNSFQNPQYFIPKAVPLFQYLRQWRIPNIGLQYDVFHAQMMEGNLVGTLKANLDLLGHVQIADAPDRHEPGTGEINYRFVLGELEKMGYSGYVSLEYNPLRSTEDSLRFLPKECRVKGTVEQLAL